MLVFIVVAFLLNCSNYEIYSAGHYYCTYKISVRNVEYCLKNESSKNNFGVWYQMMKKQGGRNRTERLMWH